MSIDPDSVYVWLHTWHKRDKARLPCVVSLDASDLRGRYVIHRQPPDIHRMAFYLSVLDTVCASTRHKYMLRLEDDVAVNKHLLHNVCTWPAIRLPKFGMGFFSTCDLILSRPHVLREPRTKLVRYRGHRCSFGGAWLVPIDALRNATNRHRIETTLRWYDEDHNAFAPTTSVSNAVHDSGKHIYIHMPALVKIDVSMPSHQLGDVRNRYGHQPYDPNWRRG